MKFADINLKELEWAHYYMQVGMYLSGFKKISNAILVYSDIIDDYYWNYATMIDINDKKSLTTLNKVLEDIENFYISMNRNPACYITPQTNPHELPTILNEREYKLAFSDAWMMFKSRKINNKRIRNKDLVIKTVKNLEDLGTFIKVFEISFGDSSEEDPYSGLPPSYKKAIYNSFTNEEYQKEKTVTHYLGILDDKPVGITTLITYKKFGGIYNVGVIPEYRKQGIGSTLSLKAVKDALEKFNEDIVFLQTEYGSYVEKFYKKLGFETVFRGDCYVKS